MRDILWRWLLENELFKKKLCWLFKNQKRIICKAIVWMLVPVSFVKICENLYIYSRDEYFLAYLWQQSMLYIPLNYMYEVKSYKWILILSILSILFLLEEVIIRRIGTIDDENKEGEYPSIADIIKEIIRKIVILFFLVLGCCISLVIYAF